MHGGAAETEYQWGILSLQRKVHGVNICEVKTRSGATSSPHYMTVISSYVSVHSAAAGPPLQWVGGLRGLELLLPSQSALQRGQDLPLLKQIASAQSPHPTGESMSWFLFQVQQQNAGKSHVRVRTLSAEILQISWRRIAKTWKAEQEDKWAKMKQRASYKLT